MHWAHTLWGSYFTCKIRPDWAFLKCVQKAPVFSQSKLSWNDNWLTQYRVAEHGQTRQWKNGIKRAQKNLSYSASPDQLVILWLLHLMGEEDPPIYGLLRATGIVYQLEEAETTIGRGEDCSIPLEGRGVSKLHARLCLGCSSWFSISCYFEGHPQQDIVDVFPPPIISWISLHLLYLVRVFVSVL